MSADNVTPEPTGADTLALQDAVERAEAQLEGRREEAAVMAQQLETAIKGGDAEAILAMRKCNDEMPMRLLADQLALKRAEINLARATIPVVGQAIAKHRRIPQKRVDGGGTVGLT